MAGTKVYRPATALGRAASLCVGAAVIGHLAEMLPVAAADLAAEPPSFLSPVYISASDLVAALDLAAVVVFCAWWYRVAVNAAALGAQSLNFSPAAAVWAFFIPLLHLVRPYRVAQEIWKASDPRAWPNDDIARRRMPDAGLVSTWWGTFLVAGGVHVVKLNDSSGDSLFLSAEVELILSYILFTIAGICALLLIREVSRRQGERARLRPLLEPAAG